MPALIREVRPAGPAVRPGGQPLPDAAPPAGRRVNEEQVRLELRGTLGRVELAGDRTVHAGVTPTDPSEGSVVADEAATDVS
jgi:hypothetical protein